jgi:uncharacterized glyoxalase superfamily protein PhnB
MAKIAENTSFLVYYAQSIERTHQFWLQLGTTIKQKAEDKVVVAIGGYEIHYIQENTEPFAEYQFATSKQGRGQGALLYFGVTDIDGYYQLAKDKQVQTRTEVLKNHWDSREFMFSDPDGYLFVVYLV